MMTAVIKRSIMTRYYLRRDNRPMSQIPQCIRQIWRQNFVTEISARVHISVTKWCIMGYGFDALWDLCHRSIAKVKLMMRRWHGQVFHIIELLYWQPPVTGEFSLQGASNAFLCLLRCQHEQTVEQIMEVSLI